MTTLRAQAVENPARDRLPLFLTCSPNGRSPQHPRRKQPNRRDRRIEPRRNLRMWLVQGAAEAAFPRDSNESRTIGTRRVHLVINGRPRRVTNAEPGAPQPLRHLGLFLMAACSRPQAFVERADLAQRLRPKGHVRPEYSADFDDVVTVVDDRQIHVDGRGANLPGRILDGKNASFHRGEFLMLTEKSFHLGDVFRRDYQIVVQACDYFTASLADREVL